MKIKITLLSIISLLFFSCLPPAYKEGDKTALEVEKLSLIPYQVGQKINFIHSGGYAFDFKVAEDNTVWTNNKKDLHPTNVTKYYETFQVRTVKLVSDYPDFEIEIITSSESRYDKFLEVKVNNLGTYIPINSDYKLVMDPTSENFHQTIVINGKIYNNVIEAKLGTSIYSIGETDKSILYNELGLLQIKLSDDETLSINN